ncbi:MAG: hypothetical protein ACJAWL_002722 [Motiliproteus sp.]|jgi:hypothetical protein
MNIDIPEDAKVSNILKTVQSLDEGGHIYCGSERHFSILKICLIKLQKRDVNIYLLDDHGFTLKQVSARKRVVSVGSEDATEHVIAQVAPSTASKPSESSPAAIPVDNSVPPPLATRQPAIQAPIEQGLSHAQISAVRDLEQCLRRCKQLGLLVIGFSDGLVAVPESLGSGADAISSADALEVESYDAYRGYEADDDG